MDYLRKFGVWHFFMNQAAAAERSIIKTYRKRIWNNFVGALKEYELLSPGDCVGVCISGGKDSMLLAKCMQLLQRTSDFPFELKFLVMDPGYQPENLALIEENARILDIPILIHHIGIFRVVEKAERSPCYLCARMRRGHLYRIAQEAGCNKIALGHHFDDVIETTLMSMLYGGEIRTMMPKLKSQNFAGMELIRPLYLVREAAVLAWRNYNGLSFIRCACSIARLNESGEQGSKRQEMKQLVAEFRRISPYIDENIMRSTHNVNLETVTGYRAAGKKHSFLENYGGGTDDGEPEPK